MSRRRFLQAAGCTLAASPLALLAADALPVTPADDASANLLGPKQGYSPLVGTLVSMLTWMRAMVVLTAKDLKPRDLDFCLDDQANTVGAMLLHLAATETYYALHTFEGVAWDEWPEAARKKWDVASNLGAEARKTIKGRPADYYLQALAEARARTLAGLKARDDKWLLAVDPSWPWGPTNNFCKWFHVCEHESNHRGQMKLVLKRVPGAAGRGE
jgi:uncharacterized damage-inducible protein DinB